MRRLFALAVVCSALTAAENTKPLVLADQGSFFVGGETKSSNLPNAKPDTPPSDVTINQMYVQYQKPVNAGQHAGRDGAWMLPQQQDVETTPDGRMGWSEYFVRKGCSVYLADRLPRARSGFDATIINAVKAGAAPPSQLRMSRWPAIRCPSTLFRFGPTFNTAFPDEQRFVQAADELYKQMIPTSNALLPTPNPTWKNMAALGVQLHGAVLIGHSESGFFPEEAALIDPTGGKGIVSIEMACTTTMTCSSHDHGKDSHPGHVRRPSRGRAGTLDRYGR